MRATSRASALSAVVGAALITTLGALFLPVSAEAQERPELYLSWNAPYGTERAKDSLTRACGDTTVADTLYLSYRLFKRQDAFSGILATLLFQPQFSDSMQSPWDTEAHNPSWLRCEFPSDTTSEFKAGWVAAGVGGYRYYAHPTQGMVRLIFAVPATQAQPVAPGLYSFARVIVKRPPESEGCDEGMCVEFRGAKFSFSVNAPSQLGVQKRSSFVNVNSATGLACSKYRRMAETRRQEVLAKEAAAKAKAEAEAEASAAADSASRN